MFYRGPLGRLAIVVNCVFLLRGVKDDYICVDHYFTEEFGLECIEDESSAVLSNVYTINVPLSRKNKDFTINAYRNQMLDVCKNMNIFILNGRLGNTERSSTFTCKTRSTVDYFCIHHSYLTL